MLIGQLMTLEVGLNNLKKNEKDFQIEKKIANTPDEAIYYFTTIYPNLHFFKITIKEI